MKPTTAVLFVSMLALTACDRDAVVDGRLTAPDGRADTECEVELHDEVGDPGSGLRCHERGAPGQDPASSVVRIGREFECITVATSGAIDLTAACDGYETYRSAPITWSDSPRASHLGDIVLKPTKPE